MMVENLLYNSNNTKKIVVCVLGLGFVGAAMSVATVNALASNGNPLFQVYGIDLPTDIGTERINLLNKGVFPFDTIDSKLIEATKNILKYKNFLATSDTNFLQSADIIIIDINLDIYYDCDNNPYLELSAFKEAMCVIGKNIKANALIIVETTVPPGTCEKLVKPIIISELVKRGLPTNNIKIAHSYERVMPGDNYYDSIINYWRVFSGIDKVSETACEKFLSKIINVKYYPLSKLSCTTASEIAKLLENSYRAANIAFIEEWGRFAEDVGINLFEVINAIRVRPTHSNMGQPGFGVGGYCLTKDPYFAKLAATDLYNIHGHDFQCSINAVKINNQMPLVSLDKIKRIFNGNIQFKKILLLGISYKQDVGDTRFSPSEIFARAALAEGAFIDYYDPLVPYWAEMEIFCSKYLPEMSEYDVVVLAVKHSEYSNTTFIEKLIKSKIVIFDANKILSEETIRHLRDNHCHLYAIGRGDI